MHSVEVMFGLHLLFSPLHCLALRFFFFLHLLYLVVLAPGCSVLFFLFFFFLWLLVYICFTINVGLWGACAGYLDCLLDYVGLLL